MRKLANLFLVIAMLTTVFSCGKDDDPVNSSDNSLVGNWKMVEFNYDGISTTNAGGQSISSVFEAEATDMTYSLVFTEDTYTSSGDYTIQLSTTTVGTTFDQTVPVTDVNSTGGYTYDETTITVESGSLVSYNAGGTTSSDMSSNEPTNYVIDANGDLIFEDVFMSSQTQQGAVSTSEIDLYMRFEKQ